MLASEDENEVKVIEQVPEEKKNNLGQFKHAWFATKLENGLPLCVIDSNERENYFAFLKQAGKDDKDIFMRYPAHFITLVKRLSIFRRTKAY